MPVCLSQIVYSIESAASYHFNSSFIQHRMHSGIVVSYSLSLGSSDGRPGGRVCFRGDFCAFSVF